MAKKKLLTYQEAADFINAPIGTLYALVSEKRLPHVKIGNRFIRFEEDALLKWLDEKRVKTNEEVEYES